MRAISIALLTELKNVSDDNHHELMYNGKAEQLSNPLIAYAGSPTSENGSEFVCDCEEQNRSACVNEPFHKTYNDKSYCILHFPGEDKAEEFERVLQRKLAKKDFNFRGTWFPNELPLANCRFSAEVDFSYATFTVLRGISTL